MNHSARARGLAGCLLAFAFSTIACGSAKAAPVGTPARISIASPSGGQAVAGVVPVAIAYDAGVSTGKISAVSLWVDDTLYVSRGVFAQGPRGTDYLDLDTRRLANGQHVVKVVAYSDKRVVASDDCVVNVSNGGMDLIAPLVSFRHLMDGDVVSGTFDLEVNAADNDQVHVVSIFVNRWPVLIKSSAPYTVPLDTTRYQDQNGKATLKLEAWAYDRANNLGKARPITVYVDNQPNATPAGPDPARTPMRSILPAPLDGPQPLSARTETAAHVGEPALTEDPMSASPVSGTREAPPASSRPATSRTPARAGEPGEPSLSNSGSAAARMADRRGREPAARPSGAPVQLAKASSARAPEIVPGRPEVARAPIAPPTVTRPVRVAAVPRTPAAEIVAGDGGAAAAATGLRSGMPTEARTVRVAAAERTTTPEIVVDLSAKGSGANGPRFSAPVAPAPRGELVTKQLVIALAPVMPAAPAAMVPAPAKLAVPPTAAKAVATKAAPAAATTRKVAVQPLMFAWDPRSRPNSKGRYAMRVYRGRTNPYPRERDYRVKAGDTLSGIARAHHVTPRSILVASGLADNAPLRSGMSLRIPGTFDVVMNDRRVAFDVTPQVQNGMPLAPFRQIMEHAGGAVQWTPQTQTVRGTTDRVEIELQIGSAKALVNQQNVELDRAAYLDRGRTMVPIRFIEEALDLKAEYDPETGAIHLVQR